MAQSFEEYCGQSSSAIAALPMLSREFHTAVEALASTLKSQGTIYFAGNGGSASDAQHLAAEFVGRFELERRALRSICLNTDTSIITALANDYGYEQVFSRQVEALGRRGDSLVLISTSGQSANTLKACMTARLMGLTTIALTGPPESPLASSADIVLAVGNYATCHIQECHIVIGQALCSFVEKCVVI